MEDLSKKIYYIKKEITLDTPTKEVFGMIEEYFYYKYCNQEKFLNDHYIVSDNTYYLAIASHCELVSRIEKFAIDLVQDNPEDESKFNECVNQAFNDHLYLIKSLTQLG